MGGDDDPVLPVDIHKEEVRKGSYPTRSPKKGDEVRIHYAGSRASDGFKFGSSHQIGDGKPYSFKLGVGAVMEAWDRTVATMKKGELSRFTIPEMYLHGGPQELLDSLPDDCDPVIYEIELVGITSITDMFGDGGVIQTVINDGEDYARPPKVGNEVQLDYELQSSSGQVLDKRALLDFKIGGPYPDGVIPGKVLDKVLQTMKRQELVTLHCRPRYGFGDAGHAALGVAANSDVIVRLELKEVYEIQDVGKKASWEEGLVIKKAVKVVRSRLVPGFDGTRCRVRLLKVTCGDEEVEGEQEFEFVPGHGDVCDALECACARMPKGELALVTVNGPASLRTPGKPDGAAALSAGPVVYHVEMLEHDQPPPEDGPGASFERLGFCREQKERGSAHFKAGRVRLAQERYARIIELLPRYKREEGSSGIHVEFFEYEEDRRAAQELRSTCRLNLAACALKLEEFYAAVRHCDDVLKDDSANMKALYRRAQGKLGTKDFDDAAQSCRRMLELDADSKDAQVLLQRVLRTQKEQAKAQRAQWAGKLQGK